jgi:hypothetical protein
MLRPVKAACRLLIGRKRPVAHRKKAIDFYKICGFAGETGFLGCWKGQSGVSEGGETVVAFGVDGMQATVLPERASHTILGGRVNTAGAGVDTAGADTSRWAKTRDRSGQKGGYWYLTAMSPGFTSLGLWDTVLT